MQLHKNKVAHINGITHPYAIVHTRAKNAKISPGSKNNLYLQYEDINKLHKNMQFHT
jgi:hypothetical protein